MKITSFIIIALMVLFLFGGKVFSKESDSRRSELSAIVDEELREIIRLNKTKKGSDPQLLLRLAELYLDKARIVKEDEMEKYMSVETSKRSGIDKKALFQISSKYFSEAQKICVHILKSFTRFHDIANVYYVLAYNAKEFQDNQKALAYFKKAVEESNPSSPVHKKSKIALAEMYYLSGDYPKAAPLYASSLKGEKDKWWTKDSYNLAWAYFRQEKYKDAIAVMRSVYSASKDKNFVDMSYNATKDLAYFYAVAGEPEKAVEFYKTLGGDVALNLYGVGKNLLSVGKYTVAENLLTQAAKEATNSQTQIKIYLELLPLYERYEKLALHYKASETLTDFALKGGLQKDDIEFLKNQELKISAILQRSVAAKTYQGQPKLKSEKAEYAVSYFKLLAKLEPEKASEHYFHAAETFYAAERFNDSLALYDESQMRAGKAGDRKTREQAITGLMAALGQKGVSKENESKYLETAYQNYLANNPRSQKSFTIYQRLFNSQMEKKDIPSTEKTLLQFKRSFPEATDKQEVMLTSIIDYYKAQNDKAQVKNWVSKISSGEFEVSAPVAKKLKMLMLSMQFDNVEAANSKGDKSKALRLYVDIYKDKESNAEAKKNAAYNIMTLFYQLGDTAKMYAWGERALQLMNGDDVLRFEVSLLLVAAELYNRRAFKEAAQINEMILKKVCKLPAKNKDVFFKNAVILYLAETKIEEARQVVKYGSSCSISSNVVFDVQMDILEALQETERWSSYEDQIGLLEKNQKAWPDLIRHLGKLREAYETSSKKSKNAEIVSKIEKLYEASKKSKLEIPLLSLDVVATLRLEKLEGKIQNLKNIKLSFPEKIYNERLKAKFKALDSLTASALEILDLGSGIGITAAYKILVENYKILALEIQGFTPPDKGPEYVESFKKSMQTISMPLFTKAQEFSNEAKKQIQTSKILSEENAWFFVPIDNLGMRYEYPSGAILMDKGGRR